ncbi:VOC family protein, partial [Candidatus Entotheonella palauensis]|uniref:VOC family protein n=1 Tax=Candidatus Entotheonella palauensis TaxID=93172 RepID=UPI001C4E06B5
MTLTQEAKVRCFPLTEIAIWSSVRLSRLSCKIVRQFIVSQMDSIPQSRKDMDMSIPREIGHLVLNVTDVERSTAFYRDVVGFQVARYRPDGTGTFLTCGVVHHNLALFKAP